MQAHERVREKNKLELEEKMMPIEIILQLKGVSLKDHIGRMERRTKIIFSRILHHSIKVLVLD